MSGTTKQGACRHNSWRGGNPSIVVAITKTTNRDPIATVGRACRNNEMKSTVPRPSRPHPRRRHVFYKTSSCGNTKLGLLVLCSEPLLAIFATFLALRVPGHFHAATAFRAHSWVTASTTGHHRRRHQLHHMPLEATTASVTTASVNSKGAGDVRDLTKKALLESVGYGVVDPEAYRTFSDSPLPPKLRPTTHIRIADGVHTFGQEFLGVPPEEGISKFSENVTPTNAAWSSIPFSPDMVNRVALAASAEKTTRASGGEGNQSRGRIGQREGTGARTGFVSHPKLPALGTRMTVVRLGNGELLFYSPAAPTVELLDMLRECFPAIGPTSKVHLVSPSWSPESWVFVKYWKAVFPSAIVWAVTGPHRRLIGEEIHHTLTHSCGAPEEFGGEVEVAVLEGVPVVREALLLHRPTGTLLSADLLMAMDKKDQHQRYSDAVGDGDSRKTPPSSSEPMRFGDHSHNRGTNGVFSSESERASDGRDDDDSVKQAGRGGGRRMRWRLLDRTASLLDMDTLAVFAPFKTILHAVKGNSADFSTRVLGWDAKIFVGCHGQSPLQGPELKGMLHAAIGRYLPSPEPDKKKKKKRGTRLLALLPGRRGDGDRHDDRVDGDQDPRLASSSTASSTGRFRFGESGDYLNPSAERRRAQAEANAGNSGAQVDSSSATHHGAASIAPLLPPPPHMDDAAACGERDVGGRAEFGKSERRPVPRADGVQDGGQRYRHQAPIVSSADSRSSTGIMPGQAVGAIAKEDEERARRYVQEKTGAAGAPMIKSSTDLSPVIAPAQAATCVPHASEVMDDKMGTDTNIEGEVAAGGKASSKNPFVKGQGDRYDEQPVGPLQDGFDPFEEPFYPFTEDEAPGSSMK